MKLRAYRTEDCREITELFFDTVHTINAKDYIPEQLDVWAPEEPDMDKWNASLLAHYSIVAEEDGKIIGFGDLAEPDYLDRLYIHKNYQKKGVACAICKKLEQKASGKVITHASITARPFFEKRGYRVIREQQVQRAGIFLTNFVMEKAL